MAYSSPLERSVSQTFLAHTVLAHISPEVSALDNIIALQSKGSLRIRSSAEHTKTLADVPTELLLIVRSYLVPVVTDSLISETMLAYADSLLSRARRLCGECLKYNVQVYGPDALTWPSSREGLSEDAQGCACGTWALRDELSIAESSSWRKLDVSTLRDTFEHKAGSKRGHKRTHSYSIASANWLEEYLAKRAGRGKRIRDVVRDVLAEDFGCFVIGEEDESCPSRPSSSNAYVPDSVTIVAPPSCLPPSAEDRLSIVARELALLKTDTTGSELLTTARDMAASVIAEAAAAMPASPDCTMPKRATAQGPSLATLIGAGLAIGAYALTRLNIL